MIARVKRKLTDDKPFTPQQFLAAEGRPSTYDPKLFPKTAKFLAQRGATQAEIADCFGVTTRTLQNWINQYPELDEAIQAGNDVFNPRVERALAERAIGFYVDEYTWVTNPETQQKELQVCGRKYYPPDVTAGIYWSKNRMRDRWRDVQEQVVERKILQSSEEILAELRQDILELQAQGVQILPPAPGQKMKVVNPEANGSEP